MGVQLFFVLSGFLITGILLDSRRASNYYSSFWIRRILRIFPLYFAALFVFLVAFPMLLDGTSKYLPSQSHRIYYWMYLNNWIPIPVDGRLEHILGHFWSLAVEEQFYLVWPVVVWLLPGRRLFRFCLVACFVVLAARSWCVLGGVDPNWIYRNTVLRADALMLGSMAAVVVREPDWRQTLARWLKPAFGGTMALAAAVLVIGRGTHYLHPPVLAVGFTMFAGAFAAGLTAVVNGTVSGWWLEHPMLRWLGRHSYGMYVWHWPMTYAMYYSYPWMGVSGLAGQMLMFAAGLSGSSLLGWLSYELYEKHFLRFKQNFKVQTTNNEKLSQFDAPIRPKTMSRRPPEVLCD